MVQIIKGSYGMRVGKTIKPVSANDGPVELPRKKRKGLSVSVSRLKLQPTPKTSRITERESRTNPQAKKARVKTKRTPKRKTTTRIPTTTGTRLPTTETKKKRPQTNCPNSMRPMPSFE